MRSTGSQSYCVGLWTGHRFREPIFLAAHACWSLGGTIGPFIVAHFLVDLPHTETTILNATAIDDIVDDTSMSTGRVEQMTTFNVSSSSEGY